MIEAFKEVIAAGDVGEARRLLEANAEVRAAVNAPLFSFGQRPVSRAAKNLGMVDLLLEFGADLNLKSDWWAGAWGILETAEAGVAEELIRRGAVVDVFAAAHLDKMERLRELLEGDPELVHAKGGDGCRALHFSRSGEAMDLLLSRGAEIDARDVDHVATAARSGRCHGQTGRGMTSGGRICSGCDGSSRAGRRRIFSWRRCWGMPSCCGR